ncbi:MAG: hypothetical protein EOM03_12965 [Clostridia bacterium]|nr:hypothetical protein [Clostridia bacterium]
MKSREKIVEAQLLQAAFRELRLNLQLIADLQHCPNYDHVARWITETYHYGPHAETGQVQAHLDADRLHASSLTLAEIVRIMMTDPETAHLCRATVTAWTPPETNPWLPESMNLTLQGQVVRHDPDLAEKWAAQAKQREHALRRASNA